MKILRILFGRHELKPERKAMFTWRFWREAIERAVKTSAQFVIGAGILGEGADFFALDFGMAAGFALTGAVLSLLTSLTTFKLGADNSPSAIS